MAFGEIVVLDEPEEPEGGRDRVHRQPDRLDPAWRGVPDELMPDVNRRWRQ